MNPSHSPRNESREKDARRAGELIRKDGQEAAEFLISLGTERAVEVFKRLGIEEIESFTYEVARTENTEQGFSGIDYARTVLEGALGTIGAVEVIQRLTASLEVRPFRFLLRFDPVEVAAALNDEGPRDIALIFCFFEPRTAAVALDLISPERQVAVAKALAALDQVPVGEVRALERKLERKFAEGLPEFPGSEGEGTEGEGAEEMLSFSGVDVLVDAINLVPKATEDWILDTIASSDPDLVQTIKAHMFVFDDIVYVRDAAIAKVVERLDRKTLAQALVGTSPATVEKVIKNLSPSDAAALQVELTKSSGETPEAIDAAQHRFVDVIRDLEEAGEPLVD